jgi:rhodanese-related sulfurtransferase
MSESRVLEHPVGDLGQAREHFRSRLALATDPDDVHFDLERGETGFVVLDARSPEAYAAGHVPGAVSFPHRRLDAASVAALPRDKVIVTYCDGIGCNASTKAAFKLAALGFAVKEMIGGLEWWKRDGFPVATGAEPGRLGRLSAAQCGC